MRIMASTDWLLLRHMGSSRCRSFWGGNLVNMVILKCLIVGIVGIDTRDDHLVSQAFELKTDSFS